MTTINTHTTRATGTVLTAAIYNFDHVNHINNAQALNTTKIEGATPPVVAGNILVFTDTSGSMVADGGAAIASISAGKQTRWIHASDMYKFTASAGPALVQTVLGATLISALAFDPATVEDAYFSMAMPKSWNEGNISGQFYWFHPATTVNFGVEWDFFALAYSDNENIAGTGHGSAVVVDTGGTTNNLYISAETSGFTVGGSVAENDWVTFLIRRNATGGADTLAVDALLIGLKLFFTTNANTDA